MVLNVIIKFKFGLIYLTQYSLTDSLLPSTTNQMTLLSFRNLEVCGSIYIIFNIYAYLHKCVKCIYVTIENWPDCLEISDRLAEKDVTFYDLMINLSYSYYSLPALFLYEHLVNCKWFIKLLESYWLKNFIESRLVCI